jgi:hypothetical protein
MVDLKPPRECGDRGRLERPHGCLEGEGACLSAWHPRRGTTVKRRKSHYVQVHR